MTGLSSSELCIWLHTSPIPISHVLQSLLCSPVPLFLCSSVLLLLRFYVSLFGCAPYFTSFMSRAVFPSTFCVSHFPLSVASFLSYFFPLFSHFLPRHYSSLQSYSSVLLISIRPHKSDGKQMPKSKHKRVITRAKYFFLAFRMTKSI